MEIPKKINVSLQQIITNSKDNSKDPTEYSLMYYLYKKQLDTKYMAKKECWEAKTKTIT